MTTQQNTVRDWMIKFGQEVNDTPTIPSLEVRKLRAKLILEEALETIEALGIYFSCHDYELCDIGDAANLIKIADGIADSLVVQLGTAVACGINIQPVFEEVMRSNDSKLWTRDEIEKFNDVKNNYRFRVLGNAYKLSKKCYVCKDSAGKVIKSPSYSPANIQL